MADLNVNVSDSDSLSESIALRFPFFDEHKNFAYSTIVTAPNPATTGTTLTVQSGQGTLFPTPPFNATVWQTGVQPTTTNSEIVRVIATNGSNGVNGDTFTLASRITRTEVINQSRAILIGDQIANTETAKVFTDIENNGTPFVIAYKFSVYRNAGATTGNNAFAVVQFDTEEFDTGNNVAIGVFTAPVAGFYQLNWGIQFQSSSNTPVASLFKNNSELKRGSRAKQSTGVAGSVGSVLVQLAANDAMDIRAFAETTTNLEVNAAIECFFMGYLVSLT